MGRKQPGLEPEKPLVPGQAPETHWPPRQGVETLLGVAGRKVMTPGFLGLQDQLTMTYHVPPGSSLGRGGGRRCLSWHICQLLH